MRWTGIGYTANITGSTTDLSSDTISDGYGNFKLKIYGSKAELRNIRSVTLHLYVRAKDQFGFSIHLPGPDTPSGAFSFGSVEVENFKLPNLSATRGYATAYVNDFFGRELDCGTRYVNVLSCVTAYNTKTKKHYTALRMYNLRGQNLEALDALMLSHLPADVTRQPYAFARLPVGTYQLRYRKTKEIGSTFSVKKGEIRDLGTMTIPAAPFFFADQSPGNGTGHVYVGDKLSIKPLRKPLAGDTLSYSWKRGSKTIKGANKRTYKVVEADRGYAIKGYVTLKRSTGVTTTERIATSSKVHGKKLKNTSKPRITGTLKVGSKIKAKVTSWGPGKVKLKYQWTRDGKAIPGATKSAYKLRLADRGTKIKVTVTGTKKGYMAVTKHSSPTRKIK